jgi:2-methylcitrate dehydratase PrpD
MDGRRPTVTRFVPLNQEDPMNTFCRMVIETKFEDLPRHVVTYAKYSILDTIGVIIGGSGMEGIGQVVSLVKSNGGTPESLIPLYGGKVPASEAALAIGPMARAMDFGQHHEEAGHSSEYNVPTLLASCGLKPRVTGKEFITAFVLGQEIVTRVNCAWKSLSQALPRGRSSGGSIFGAAAAAGKLLGLSLDELENAEGIAREKTQPHDLGLGTLMVRVHHGFVCHDAITACLLARLGITGPRREVLLGPRGYLEMAKWDTDPGALTEGLGEKWEMLNVMMKPYSSCACTHTPVDGILDQMREHGFKAEEISRIHVEVSPTTLTMVCRPIEAKWNPSTVPDCQFSLPYTVASAAHEGRLFLDAYTPEAMARHDVRHLMTRISATADPNLPSLAARVTTTLKNGKVCAKEYIYVKGHPKNPFTERELIERFKMCVPYSVYNLSDPVVDSVIETILHLEHVHDVTNDVIVPLTPP